jgi:hypothetical protein
MLAKPFTQTDKPFGYGILQSLACGLIVRQGGLKPFSNFVERKKTRLGDTAGERNYVRVVDEFQKFSYFRSLNLFR